jgi:hypothetical protein
MKVLDAVLQASTAFPVAMAVPVSLFYTNNSEAYLQIFRAPHRNLPGSLRFV